MKFEKMCKIVDNCNKKRDDWQFASDYFDLILIVELGSKGKLTHQVKIEVMKALNKSLSLIDSLDFDIV